VTFVSARFVAVIAAVLATACAAVDDQARVAEPKAPREYRTGSNIPVKEPRVTTDEERAQAAEQMRQLQQGGAAARP
jgi:hypothetical protein